MKKVASLVATALIACSLIACGNRNAAFKTPGTNQSGTNLSINQRNNMGTNNIAYKDGVYLGEGNKTSKGNQAAIVTITGGRITSVILKTLDAQGKEVYTGNTTQGTTNSATGGMTGITPNGTVDGTPGSISNGTAGRRTTGTMVGNNVTGGTTGGATDGGAINRRTNVPNVGESSTPGGTTNRNDWRDYGIANGSTSGGNNNVTALTNLERIKRDLSSAIVSQQTHDVNVTNAGNEITSVNNWKLAVSRALDSAKK